MTRRLLVTECRQMEHDHEEEHIVSVETTVRGSAVVEELDTGSYRGNAWVEVLVWAQMPPAEALLGACQWLEASCWQPQPAQGAPGTSQSRCQSKAACG